MVGAVLTPGPAAAAALRRASWARRAVEVPDRCDQPGRRGPSAAKTDDGQGDHDRTDRGGAPCRGREGATGDHAPGDRRPGRPPRTARRWRASPGSEVSVPLPRPWIERDRPAQIGQPVDEAPGRVADAPAEGAGDQDGEQEVEAEGPEPHVDGAVGGAEGDRTRRAGRSARTRRATVVATWIPTKTRHSSDRLRWTSWERNRGHRSVVHPTEATTPTTRVAVNSTSATRPLERVRYQSALLLEAEASSAVWTPNGITGTGIPPLVNPRATRPPRRPSRPRGPGAPGGAGAASHAGCCIAEHHGRGRGDVGVDAGPGGHRDRAPARADRQSGGRVDQVVHAGAAEGPVAAADAGGGEPARLDRDRGRCVGIPADVGDADREAAGGSRLDREVAAEGDHRPAAEAGGDLGGCPVGRPGLGGRSEIEHDAVFEEDGRPCRVDQHRAPSGDRRRRWQPAVHPGGDRCEVAVVAEAAEGGRRRSGRPLHRSARRRAGRCRSPRRGRRTPGPGARHRRRGARALSSESARKRLATCSTRSSSRSRSEAAATISPGSVTTSSMRVDQRVVRCTAVGAGATPGFADWLNSIR